MNANRLKNVVKITFEPVFLDNRVSFLFYFFGMQIQDAFIISFPSKLLHCPLLSDENVSSGLNFGGQMAEISTKNISNSIVNIDVDSSRSRNEMFCCSDCVATN